MVMNSCLVTSYRNVNCSGYILGELIVPLLSPPTPTPLPYMKSALGVNILGLR